MSKQSWYRFIKVDDLYADFLLRIKAIYRVIAYGDIE